jgi:hypothetical protein
MDQIIGLNTDCTPFARVWSDDCCGTVGGIGTGPGKSLLSEIADFRDVVPQNSNFSSRVLDCAFAATPAQNGFFHWSLFTFPLSFLPLYPFHSSFFILHHPYLS